MVSIPTGAHCRELASVTMCETAIPGSALELLPLSSLPYTTPAYSYILPCPKIKSVSLLHVFQADHARIKVLMGNWKIESNLTECQTPMQEHKGVWLRVTQRLSDLTDYATAAICRPLWSDHWYLAGNKSTDGRTLACCPDKLRRGMHWAGY